MMSLPVFDGNLIDRCIMAWRATGLDRKLRAAWPPHMAGQQDNLFCRLFEPATNDLDLVILGGDGIDPRPLQEEAGGFLLPVVDIGGGASDVADVRFDILEPESWTETARYMLRLRQRRSRLAQQHLHTVDPEIRLLAQIHVLERELRGRYDPRTPEVIVYPRHPPVDETVAIAERLVERGFLQRAFFDRLHECLGCGSRRVNVREECPTCRSADMNETSFIHHFHCATVLPEQDFRRESTLICPECALQLKSYGKDYDRPGSGHRCNQCNGMSSEVEVGFICLDCGSRMKGETAEWRDFHHYSISEKGRIFLETPERNGRPPSLSRHGTAENPHGGVTIAEIRLDRREELIEAKGRPFYEKSRELFLEGLRNHLPNPQALYVADDNIYLRVLRQNPASREVIDALLERCDNMLCDRLYPTLVTPGTRVVS